MNFFWKGIIYLTQVPVSCSGAVFLVHADATKWKCFNYSHIYMYDRVFNESTLSALAGRLNSSSFKFLVTYRRFEEWLSPGTKEHKTTEFNYYENYRRSEL